MCVEIQNQGRRSMAESLAHTICILSEQQLPKNRCTILYADIRNLIKIAHYMQIYMYRQAHTKLADREGRAYYHLATYL